VCLICFLFISGDDNFKQNFLCIEIQDLGREIGGHIQTDQVRSIHHADHGPGQKDQDQEGIARDIYIVCLSRIAI